ncbi:MAG: LytTR family DNA-binding domain-containing protein [Tannerellaceae bacterium]|nr:LytTR family DNA-binding domain-containing protein [Tannerellaceae bacterium]
MRVLIIEDETAAYKNLRKILKSINPGIEIAGITESISQTVKWLLNNPPPDLIFMDIHLSDGSSFNLFSIVTIETPIVFTTAYDEYAIDAFKVNSIDYLLKPISENDLIKALDKFHRFSKIETGEYLSQVAHFINSSGYPGRILLPVNDKLLPLNISDIACFYTTDDNTRIFLKNGKSLPYSKTLENILQMLNPAAFFRANKQFIVAKDVITDITIWFDSRLLIELNIEVPERIYISKNRASEFRQWIIA